MTSAPSTKLSRALRHAWKPVAWLSAVALAVGGVTVAQQWQTTEEAEAAYPPAYGWGEHTLGTGVDWDTNTVYAVRDNSNQGIYRLTTNGPGTDWPGLITSNAMTRLTTSSGGGDGLETMAVDGGVYTGDPSGYFWGWNAHNGSITNAVGTQPTGGEWISVQYFGPNHTVSHAWRVPTPSRAHGAGSADGPYHYDYWSGGEVIQKTGEIFFSGGECDAFNGKGGAYRMMIYNPSTGTYRASGSIQPASASDDIFGNSSTTCSSVGNVSSDMALDGFGNAYILVQGLAAVGNQWRPTWLTGTRTERRIYLVRVVPGGHMTGWTYNVVQMLYPGDTASDTWNFTGDYANGSGAASDLGNLYGMAFLNGQLYLARNLSNSDIYRIDPLDGMVYHIPYGDNANADSTYFDLASAQTAYVAAGRVFNDANANGSLDKNEEGEELEEGVANQTIALYTKDSAGAWVLRGTRQTSGNGDYSFILSGKGQFMLRLVRPQLYGVNTAQTYAGAGTSTSSYGLGTNTLTAACYDYDAQATVMQTTAGVCRGALPIPYSDAGNSPLTDLSQVAIYSILNLQSPDDIPAADFGITMLGSYPDAGTGPSSVANGTPAHIVGLSPNVFLGSVLGRYSATAVDNAAHNSTDDGVYMEAYDGSHIPLNQVGVLAAQREYDNLKAQVSGQLAGSPNAQVTGWISAATAATGNGAWVTTPRWTPTITGGIASGSFVPSNVTTPVAGAQYVNFRVNVSTQTATLPTNASSQYQSTTGSPWITTGEVEDYRYQVADSAYRVAAVSNGGNGTFTIDGQTLTTAGSSKVYGVGAGAVANTAKAISVVLPNTSWQVDSVEIRDTRDGTLVASPTYNETSGTTGNFSFTPTVGQDLTVLVNFTKSPDPDKSKLELSSASATVGTDITGTVTVVTAEDVPLPNIHVRLQGATDLSLHDGATSVTECVTDSVGVCTFLITSSVAATYTDGVVAQVRANNAWNNVTDSPATVTFLPGDGRPDHSEMTVSPGVSLIVGDSSANTYTINVTVRDGDDNLKPNATVTFSYDALDGSAFDAGSGGLSATTATTDASGVASVTFSSTKPGSVRLHAQIPDPDNGNTLTGVTGSPQTRVYAVGPVTGDYTTFSVAPDDNLLDEIAVATLNLRDEYDNPVPDRTQDSLNITTGCASLSDFTEVGDGVYTFNLTATGDTVCDTEISVVPSTGLELAQDVIWRVPEPTDTYSDLTLSHTSQTVGQNVVATVTVRDQHDRPITGLPSTAVVLTSLPDDVSLTNFQELTSPGDEGKYTWDLTSEVAGLKDITAVVSSVTFNSAARQVTFVPDDPDETMSSFVVTPDSLQVQGTATATLWVKDQYGNGIPGVTPDLAYASSLTRLTGPVAGTGPNVGEYVWTLTTSTADTYTLTAKVPMPAAPDMELTDQVTFLIGGLGSVSFQLDPGSALVSDDAGATVEATVTVLDSTGVNGVPGLALDDLNLSYLKVVDPQDHSSWTASTNVQVVPGSFQEGANGVYTFQVYSTVVGDYEATASVQGIVNTTSPMVSFSAASPDDTNTSFGISPTTQVPGSQVTGTVTVQDAFGNPIDDLVAGDFDLDADGLTVVSGPTQTTPGVYTYVFSADVTRTYDPVVTVDTVTKTASVQYRFGDIDVNASLVTVNPPQQVVGQYVQITVTVKDSSAAHNLINNLTQSDFTVTATSQTPGVPNLTASFVSNNGDGTYTFNVTSRLVGPFAVQATVQGFLLNAHPPITFIAGGVCVTNCSPIDPTHITRAEMIVNDKLSDGNSQDQARIYAYDTYGNPVPNAPIVATAAAGNLALTPQTNSDVTGLDGTVVLSWTSLIQGVYTATVTADGLTPTVGGVLNQIRFTQTQPAEAILTITPDGPLTVGGTYTAEILVRDAQSTPLEGITVSFSAPFVPGSSNEPNPSATLSDLTCQTGLNGRCSVTLTSRIAGTYNVTATVPVQGQATHATNSPTPVTFTAGPVCVTACQPVDPTRITRVEVTKSGLPPGQTAEATVYAHDTFGNAVAATFNTSTTDSGLTIVTSSVTTGSDGTGILRYTSVVAGAHPADVVVDGQTPTGSPISLVFVANPGEPSNSYLTVTPVVPPADPQAVGGMYTITATVLDSTNVNRINGIPITFSGQPGLTFVNGVSSCTTTGTGATAGTCSVLVSSKEAKTFQVGATMPNAAGVQTALSNSPVEVTFRAGPICVSNCEETDPTKWSRVEIIKNGANFDGIDHDIVRVFAFDTYGNPVPGAAVASIPDGANLTVQPTIENTGTDGTSTIWYASTVAGSHGAHVTVGGLPPAGGWPVSLAFGSSIGDPDHSSFIIDPPGPLVVGTGSTSTYTITATVNDIFDQPVTGAVVTLRLGDGEVGPVWGGGQNVCTTVGGTCQVTLSSTKSGTYSISAAIQAGDIGTAQSRAWQADEVCAAPSGCTPVDPGLSAALRTRVVVDVDDQLADGSTPDSALLYAFDKWGNPVPSALVEPATTDSDLHIVSGTPGTNAQGVSRIQFTSTVAGPHVATVQVQGKTPTGSPITLNFKPGPISAAHTTWVIDPATQLPGQTVTGTLTLKDDQGNLIDGVAATEFSLVDDGLTVVSGPTAQGNGSGEYVYVFNASAAATYDTEVTVRSVTKTASVTYGYGEVDASASTVDISPTEQRAGQNIQVIITVKDVSPAHNPIPDLAQSAFTVSATSQVPADAPHLTGSFVSNNGDGTYTFTINSQLVGKFNVQATVNNVLLNDHPEATFIAGGVCVTNCTPVISSHVTRAEMVDNDQLSDGTSEDTARIYAYDTYGNAVSLANVRAQAAAGNAALMPQIATVQTGLDGTAMLAWTSLNEGVYTATVTVDGLDPATGVLSQIRFSQTQPDPTKSTLTVMPASPIVVGGTYTARAEVRDAQGTPLEGITVSFSAPFVPGSSNEPNPVANLSQQTCYTGLNGTCSITFTSKIAGVYAVYAKVPVQGQATNIQESPTNVAFIPGSVCVSNCQPVDPTRVTRVEVTKDSQRPNGVDEATVWAYDTYGNAVEGAAVSTTSNDSTLNVLTPNPQGGTGVDGTVVLQYSSAVAGAHPANVQVAYQTPTGSPITLNFLEGDVDPSKSFLTVTPVPSTATVPLIAGGTYTVTATVLDSTGLNRVNGVLITFSLPTGQPSGLAFVNNVNTCTTDGSGSTAGTCSVQVTSKVATTYQVRATMPNNVGGNADLSNSPVNVTFVAGPICVTACTPINPTDITRVVVTKNGAKFDGVDHNNARVYAYDAYGNPVSGAIVASTTTDSDLFIQPASTILATGADGTSTIWYASTAAGDHIANVTVGGLTPNASPITLSFGVGIGDRDRSSFTINPPGPLVVGTGSTSTYTITATVNDTFGAPVSGEVVTFELGENEVGPVWGGGLASCTTASGTCQVTLSSTKSGTYSINARLGTGPIGMAQSRAWQADEVCTQPNNCYPVDPSLPSEQRSRVVVGQDNSPADGSTPDKAWLYAFDKWGNPVPGALVEPATTDTDLRIVPGTPGTNDDGFSEIQFTSTVAGPHVATVQVQGKTPTGSPITLNFVPDQISAAHTTWVIEPANQIPGQQVTGTLTVKDAQNNSINDITAADISLVNGGLTVVSGPTFQGNGQYAYVFSATQTNTYNTELTVKGVVKTASVTYGYGSIDPNLSTVVINPTQQIAGQNVQVIVTVKDSSASHNPIPNLTQADFTVTATSQTPDTAPHLTGSFVSNNGDGTYTFYINSRLVGKFDVQATVNNVLLNAHPTATFVAGGVCVTNCTPVISSHVTRAEMIDNDRLSDGNSQDMARIYAYDTFGNAVSLANVRAQAATGNLALTPQTNTAQTRPDGTIELYWTSFSPGVYTATVTIDGLDPATGVLSQIRFNQTDPDPTKSVLTVTPAGPLTVGSSYTAQVLVRDAQGTLLQDVPVSFSAPFLPGSSTEPNPQASLSQQTCLTGANGTCSITVSSQIAGVYAVTATVPVNNQAKDVVNSPTDVTFIPGSVCVSNANPVVPGRVTRVEVTRDGLPPNDIAEATVWAYDCLGNAVSGAAVATDTIDPTLNIVTTGAYTGTDGTAKLQYSSAVAGPHQANVRVAGQTPTGSPITLNFVADPADPTQSFLTVTPTVTQVVEGVYTITATTLDSTGLNPVSGIPITFEGDPGLTFVGGVKNCTTDGTGTCFVQVTSTQAASFQVHANMPDALGTSRPLSNSPRTVTFDPGPICVTNCVSPDNTRVEIISNGANFDGIARDVVRVFARDTHGNPVPNAVVSSTTLDANLTIQPAGSGPESIQRTDANGTSTIWYTSTVAGDHIANVLVGGLTPNGSPVTLAFGSSIGDPDHSSFTFTPASPLVVGTGPDNTYTVSATVNDIYDAPVEGAVVTFKLGAGQSGPVWGGGVSACTTAADGTCQVTLSSTVSGSYSVAADLSGTRPIGQALPLAWQADEVCTEPDGCVPVNPTSPRSRVEVTTDNRAANGSTPDIATVYAYDKWGNPVPGALVESTTADPDLRILPGTEGTNDQGISVIRYTSLKARPHIAEVRVQGKTPTGSPITLNFKADTICVRPDCQDDDVDNDHRSRIVVYPDGATANGIVQDVANVYIFDGHGNPVPGAVVTQETADTDLTYQTTIEPTDANGLTTIWYTSTVADSHEARAYVEVEGVPVEIIFTPQPVPPAAGPAPLNYQSSPFEVTFITDGPCFLPSCQDPGVAYDRRSRIEVDPDNMTADGDAQDVANVYIFDGHGNPVVGAEVVQDTQDAALNAKPNADIAPTNSEGRTTIWYTSEEDGPHIAQAYYVSNGTNIEIMFPATPADPSLGTPPDTYQSSPFTVNFEAGPICLLPSCQDPDVPFARRTHIEVLPNDRIANGQDADLANVYIFDGHGNPIEGAVVTQSNNDASLSVQGPIDETDANGLTTIAYTTTVAGQHTARAYVEVNGVETEIKFPATPADPSLGTPPSTYQSSPFVMNFTPGEICVDPATGCQDDDVPFDKRSRIEVYPDNATADGVDQDKANVYIFDGHGNPIVGATITQSTDDARLTAQLNTDIEETDANGRTDIWYTSTQATGHTARAFVDINGVSTEIKFPATPADPSLGSPPTSYKSSPFIVTFLPGPICVDPSTGCQDDDVDNDHRSRIVVAPDGSKADGIIHDVANVYIFDGHGNPIQNAVITQEHSDPKLTVQPTSIERTDADGHTDIWYTSTLAGDHTANAYVTINGTRTPIVFTPQPEPPATGPAPDSYQSSPFTMNFQPGPPCFDEDCQNPGVPEDRRSRIVVDPDNVVADGIEHDVANVYLFDGEGNPVPGVRVQQSHNYPSLPSQNQDPYLTNQADDDIARTDANGHTDVWYATTVMGNYTNVTMEAEIGGQWVEIKYVPATPSSGLSMSSPFEMRFKAGPPCIGPDCVPDDSVPNDRRSRVVVNPDRMRSNGTEQDVAEVHLYDRWGNPTVGATVNQFMISPSLQLMTIPEPQSDATGFASYGYTSLVDGYLQAQAFVVIEGVQREVIFIPQPNSIVPPSYQSSPYILVFLDLEPPIAPVVTKPSDNESVSSDQPEFAGTGEPGATVTVTDDATGAVLCTATVGQDSHWVCETTGSLPDGDHTVTVIQEDAAGNPSDETVVHFDTDTDGPRPVIVRPSEGQHVNQSRPVVSGTNNAAGDQVVVSAGGANNVCTTTVAADLTWSCQLPNVLPDGQTTINVVATDRAGTLGNDRKDVVVDTVSPAPPTVTEPGPDEAINDNQPTVSGENGEPGNTVEVDAGGGNSCTAQVMADGTWSCQLPEVLPEGPTHIEVTETDQAGNESVPTVIEPVVDITDPDQVVVLSPTPGQWINDPTPEATGTAEPGSTVTVDAGDGNRCTVTADLDGAWSCSLPDPLPDGDHKIVVTATDPAGNTSPPVEVEFQVDTIDPPAPTVEGDEKHLDGTGEPGDTIEVTDKDGNQVCETVIDANGVWSCTPQIPVQPGDTITVVSTDPAGNTAETEYMIPIPVPTGADYGLPLIIGSGLAALLGAFFILLASRRRREEDEGAAPAV
ncbi:MAG: Ig-like domain-containing protein [Propionibacteriaceae bacterium]|jgi:hypothetical protein|nr:Ig-like domain-containing protein [Propionibacteriaceae bacterium]